MIVTLVPPASARFAGHRLPGQCLGPALQYLLIPRVVSWSMFPTLCKGDRLELGPPDPLHLGDLVVFRRPFGLVCHRLIERNGTILYTKGDASTGLPEQISIQDVLGIVVAVVRGATRVPTADLATLAPPAPWRRMLNDLSITLRERSRHRAHRLIRLLVQNVLVGGVIARQTVRWATIEPIGTSPIRSLSDAIMPTASESAASLESPPESWLLIRIRLGPLCLGLFNPGSETLDLRPVLSDTSVESALRQALCHRGFQVPPARRHSPSIPQS